MGKGSGTCDRPAISLYGSGTGKKQYKNDIVFSMNDYNPHIIEEKWQKHWEQKKTYSVDMEDTAKPKYVAFGMFPGVTGAGIHIGHARTFQFSDIKVRAKRQQGFNAYHPIGFDAFGLPVENYSKKINQHPQVAADTALKNFTKQLRRLGYSYDWDKAQNTSSPEYYRFTQEIFIDLFREGLAYQKKSSQWYCKQCDTVLANEQVVAGKCWRHDSKQDPKINKKELTQWFFKITDYADEILDATDELDWEESVKTMQKNWIGKSQGVNIIFKTEKEKDITVFTTRPETIFGVSFIAIAPDSDYTKTFVKTEYQTEVENYIQTIQEETADEYNPTKSGVFTGSYVINPVNQEKIPVWITNYVLSDYGSGAIMGVPAHDKRDYEFAEKYNLKITTVIQDSSEENISNTDGQGIMVNSGIYTGKTCQEAAKEIINDKIGVPQTTYNLKDWLISRQRFWGAPIPIIHCETHGAVPVPKEQLPVLLPQNGDYRPLAQQEDWIKTTCPKCGKNARRETDTLDGYACSSWYFLRYLDPHNQEKPFDFQKIKSWFPIGFYNGADHAIAHLLYARFFTRFFYKQGLVNSPEPFKKMMYNAYILGEDGHKMSKSKGNVIDPMEIIEGPYGADSLRMYAMFIGPYDKELPWDKSGVSGCFRFINRYWNLSQEFIKNKKEVEPIQEFETQILKIAHVTAQKVSDDIESNKFNTAIASMMNAVNQYNKIKIQYPVSSTKAWEFALQSLTQTLAPFIPHVTEEIWEAFGNTNSVHIDNWPIIDTKYLEKEETKIAVSINGKTKSFIMINNNQTQEEVIIKAQKQIYTQIANKPIKKTIYVPNRIINFVI